MQTTLNASPKPSLLGQSGSQLNTLARELLQRHARSSLPEFARQYLSPLSQEPAPHHLLLMSHLEAISRGDIDRLMVLMPPGSAKSTFASVIFPPWWMHQHPNTAIIGASHTAELAEDFSWRVQDVVREHSRTLGFGLRNESRSLWETTAGCRYRAAGVGGAVTGFRADLAIIDDPVRSRKDAESETYRDTAWNWFRSDLLTRMKPGGRIVLIQTRWHSDDLAGRLLQDQASRWRVLSLPALATDADDPMGRAIGEPLWPTWESLDQLEDKRRLLGERDWSALFQQNPRPEAGALFKAAQMGMREIPPSGGHTVRAWDLAATRQVGTRNPDWTVGIKLHRCQEGRFTVLDMIRMRGGPQDVEAAILAAAAADGPSVRVGLPQDPGQAGKAQVAALTAKLAGYRVEASPETGDKVTRAAPAAAQVNVGNVSMMRAGWNAAFADELSDFPSGQKDDAVDAFSRAFSMLIRPPQPARLIDFNLLAR